MSLESRFSRYGSRSNEAEIRILGHLIRPETLTAERIKRYDETTDRLIKEAQELISDLSEYRQALAARYGELATMPYKLALKLERKIDNYSNKKSYVITIARSYEDGTQTEEARECYEGTERHAALKRFEALKKERPGIEVIKDIEKRKWER